VLKRNAVVGLAATAFDLQPAVAAIEALCDLGGGFGLTRLPLRRARPRAWPSWRLDQCKASTDQGHRPLGVNRVGLATSESLRFSFDSGSIADIAALRICAKTDVPSHDSFRNGLVFQLFLFKRPSRILAIRTRGAFTLPQLERGTSADKDAFD
jgi:hypothetical protein